MKTSMISIWQVSCARQVCVAEGIAVRDDVDSAEVGDARTAQEAAMGAAPTKSGVQDAAAQVLAWKVA